MNFNEEYYSGALINNFTEIY